MMQIDSAILATDKVICKNISRFDDSERGLLSQNILSQLRNFVEYIAKRDGFSQRATVWHSFAV